MIIGPPPKFHGTRDILDATAVIIEFAPRREGRQPQVVKDLDKIEP
jgi:hypothetical protein